MCGIFGFVSTNRTITREDLLTSLSATRHRGPDNSGVAVFNGRSGDYCSADALPEGEWNRLFAHNRLSIIDLRDAAHQPMSNEDGSVWIVYNGEVYNFTAIREELTSRGHRFRSRSDTEVIVHGYEEWGTSVVHRLRGMFAFALCDTNTNRIILARDRLGVKPLKYYFDGGTFIFASELKGLLHLVPRKMDLAAVNTYLTLKYIPSPNTIIEGVKKLLPAELITVDMNTMHIEKECYWKPEFHPKVSCSFSDAREQFRSLLSESVLMRMVSDVPVGVYLSGGMDSSAIVAFLKKGGVDDINTFTIRFDRPGYDESGYARTVADRFQTRHHEFGIPVLTYDELRCIIHSLDEPFGDPSYIPTYFLSRFTSQHVKVILSGDGGDEILGGYKRYMIYSRGKLLQYLPRMPLSFMHGLYPEIHKKSLMGKIQKIAEALSMGYWGAYLLRFNGLSASFKRFVMAPGIYETLKPLSIDELVPDFSGSNSIKDTIERLIWIDLHTYLPDYILTKTDLALMAHSVEGRNPLVDFRLVEFANSLKPEYKFRSGGKHILKSVLEEYIPKEVIYRKKMGFSPPIKYWFRDNIPLMYDIFSKGDFISGDLFDLSRIHKVIGRFRTPEVNVSEQLWLMTVLEVWRRKYGI